MRSGIQAQQESINSQNPHSQTYIMVQSALENPFENSVKNPHNTQDVLSEQKGYSDESSISFNADLAHQNMDGVRDLSVNLSSLLGT